MGATTAPWHWGVVWQVETGRSLKYMDIDTFVPTKILVSFSEVLVELHLEAKQADITLTYATASKSYFMPTSANFRFRSS